MDKVVHLSHTPRRRGEHAVFYAKNPFPEDSKQGVEWAAGWRKRHLDERGLPHDWSGCGWWNSRQAAGRIVAFREFEQQLDARIAELRAKKKQA